jgi:LysM repeat protein
MAAKKPTRPKKFKQARKDALASAKKDFSGKKQAGLKDRTLRISADDKEVLSEMKKEARGNYITDDRGNKIQVKPTETSAERIARDRREAKAQLQRQWDIEDGKEKVREPKPAAAKAAPKGGGMNKTRTFVQATEVKPQGKVIKKKKAAAKPSELGARRLEQMKKAGISESDAKKVLSTNKPAYEKKETKPKVNKPATKGFSAGKTLTPKGQAIYDDLVKQGVKPKSAMNKAIFRQEKATPRVKITVDNKPTAPKPTAGAQALNEMGKKKGLKDPLGIEKKTTPKVDKLATLEKKVTSAKSTAKKVTTAKAAKEASTGAKVGKIVLDAAKATAAVAGPGKFLKPVKFVQAAIAGNKAVKVTKAVKAAESGKKVAAGNAARKAANAAKAEKAAKAGVKGKVKKVALAAGGFYAIDKIPTGGGSKPAQVRTLPQRPAGTYPKGGGKGLKLGPNVQVNAGGSTTSYTVKKGDTLSGIAKTSGVKLSEILAANPTIADKKSKYKGGSMIWSGTKVKLPTKK